MRRRPPGDKKALPRPGDLWISLLLAVMILAVYGQVRDFDFSNYDDPDYVTDNAHVRNGLTRAGVVWAFNSAHAANWIPLNWLSHMLDVQLFGLRSGPHHLTNVAIHIASTLLLFALLKRMTGTRWRSAFVALVFAVHPLHVESVAWVAERKDVLCALFWVLTLLAYVRYAERPSAARYALVVALFACGLLSKPMIVTVPFTALLLDVWPLRRFKESSAGRLVLEKMPLFTLALAVSAVTYLVQQRGGAVLSSDHLSLQLRIGNAFVSYVLYLVKFVWPVNLAAFYPYPPAGWPVWEEVAAGFALLGISVLVLWMIERRPFLAVGWLWYLVTLVPVIGLIQVGVQSRADRYTYVPTIGISIMLAWGAAEACERRRWGRAALAVSGVAACLAWSLATFTNIGHWRNSISLFQHAVDVTEGNYVAHNNLGAALRREGRLNDAVSHFQAALLIKPRYPEAEDNLGEALLAEGRVDEALPHISAALRLQPDLAEAHINFGTALTKRGQLDDAVTQYHEALQFQPENAEAHCGLGVALTEKGQFAEALVELSSALGIKPEYADAHYNLGRLLGLMGRTDEAITQFSEAARLQPDNAETYFNLGTALAARERFDEAIVEFRMALRLKPDYVNAHFNLGSALATQGRFDQAIGEFSEVLRLAPGFEAARQSLEYCRRAQEAPSSHNLSQ